MNWFNLSKLENQICENKLTEDEVVKYWITLSILLTITHYYSPHSYNLYAQISYAASGIIAVVTVYYSYKIHKKAGKDFFIQKYIAISWMIYIRILLVTLIYLLWYYTIFPKMQMNFKETYAINILVQIILDISYFILIIRSFKRISVE